MVHSYLIRHQPDIVAWAVTGGRRAIFTAFGLGKTLIQLEAVRQVLDLDPDAQFGLIIIPLAMRGDFIKDAPKVSSALEVLPSIAVVFCPFAVDDLIGLC